MAERMVIEKAIGYFDFILKSGVTAERGKLAVFDTTDGSVTKGSLATTLIPLGLFMNTVVGDGTKVVTVQFFHEIAARWWVNDTVDPLVLADRGTLAYIKDDQTVTGTATGASALGLVFAVDTLKGVLVYSAYQFR